MLSTHRKLNRRFLRYGSCAQTKTLCMSHQSEEKAINTWQVLYSIQPNSTVDMSHDFTVDCITNHPRTWKWDSVICRTVGYGAYIGMSLPTSAAVFSVQCQTERDSSEKTSWPLVRMRTIPTDRPPRGEI
jgi:hypothetical protein